VLVHISGAGKREREQAVISSILSKRTSFGLELELERRRISDIDMI
jgi:hypothetical protein